MEEKVLNAALAGLLHDVGKVEQRARVDPWMAPPGIELEGQPVHAAWSLYFAQNYVPRPYQAAALAGAYHHAPERSPAANHELSELVALADKLSAGERSDPIGEENNSSQPQQLISIFDRISLDGRTNPPRNYLPLRPLELKEETLFPTTAQPKAAQSEAYEQLRSELETAARRFSPDGETYLENLLAALQRLTWCIPSAYYHSVPDVSLYDHARTTAALAVCLTDWEPGQVRALLGAVRRDFTGKPQEEDDKLLKQAIGLLVGGDISGVQDFIYTLSSKKAAKTLRGRSHYLQLLTEAVLRFVLHQLGLPYTNVIYSGGGHFYLLAPLSANSRLPKIRKMVTQKLLAHHGSSLYLAINSVPVPAQGFRRGEFPKHWQAMHKALSRSKLQRYAELDDESLAQLFSAQPHGGNREKTCSVCGEESEQVKPLEDDAEGGKICPLCRSFAEDLGEKLPKASHLALGLYPPKDSAPGGALDALRSFGLSVAFGPALRFGERPERVVIWALGDENGPDQEALGDLPTAYAVRYTVNRVPVVRNDEDARRINGLLSEAERKEEPVKPGMPKTFTHLQAEAKGIARLGVLRMDVDRLGEIFQRGLVDERGESLATLARISTLSFQMALFFEGWIKRLCEAYPDKIYAVYAGGDDVFLIGPWDVMPGLAQRIASDLSRYAGGNPHVHLSGGMVFIGGKYPVYQAAEEAGEALDKAKDAGRNAFTFLEQSWSWPVFKDLASKQERLARLVEDEEKGGLGGPAAILQTLRQLSERAAETTRRRGRTMWGPWMWLGAYQLTRQANFARNTPALEAELLAIRDELQKNNYGELDQWGAAARWTQLYIRKRQKNKGPLVLETNDFA